MIKISNLTFKYIDQKNKIFKDANMEIKRGIWLLEGDNGSGKSTLFKLLTNLSEDIGEVSENAYINIDGELLLLDNNTSLPLSLYELDIAKYIFYINDIILEKQYIPIYDDRNLSLYSNGERKLATLRILSHLKIDVLLMDEYITNIDEKNILEVMEILKSINDKGTIIIVSSNEIDIKNRFNNKIIIEDKKLEVIEIE